MRNTVEEGKLPRPESVNDAVELLCFALERHSKRPVVIIDEFDHMPKSEHIQIDLLIKKIAEVDDFPMKIIMCGVGETLESCLRRISQLTDIFIRSSSIDLT